MIEIHLYGKLRQYRSYQPGQDCVVLADHQLGETIASLLDSVGIPIEELNHVFFNAKLLSTRNRKAAYFGYPQLRSDLSNWDLNIPVGDGDRLGLFGTDMAMLSM
jgi:hypothetical protein